MWFFRMLWVSPGALCETEACSCTQKNELAPVIPRFCFPLLPAHGDGRETLCLWENLGCVEKRCPIGSRCLWSSMSQQVSLCWLQALTTAGDAQWWAGAGAGGNCPLQMKSHPSLSPGTAAVPWGVCCHASGEYELWIGPTPAVQRWSKS